MDYLDTQIEDGLARVRLDRTEKRNALSLAMMEELRDTALALQRNVDVITASAVAVRFSACRKCRWG